MQRSGWPLMITVALIYLVFVAWCLIGYGMMATSGKL
jgi:hypothetical protein